MRCLHDRQIDVTAYKSKHTKSRLQTSYQKKSNKICETKPQSKREIKGGVVTWTEKSKCVWQKNIVRRGHREHSMSNSYDGVARDDFRLLTQSNRLSKTQKRVRWEMLSPHRAQQGRVGSNTATWTRAGDFKGRVLCKHTQSFIFSVFFRSGAGVVGWRKGLCDVIVNSPL